MLNISQPKGRGIHSFSELQHFRKNCGFLRHYISLSVRVFALTHARVLA